MLSSDSLKYFQYYTLLVVINSCLQNKPNSVVKLDTRLIQTFMKTKTCVLVDSLQYGISQ